jgi:NADPH-dependent glutamate synthase beta subunit-like oxidoreductase
MTDKPFAITLDVGSSLANKTGSWRTERPVYVHGTAPCGHACPAGEDVQQWLYHAEEGGYEHAWRQIMQGNPLPAIMGRVCYHPCETACNRGQLDEAVAINSVERFLGDEAIKQGWTVKPLRKSSGKRVLVVGAGPSGLSAAYHLTGLGHAVTIMDAGPRAGGMMRFGIPSYRLPRDVLDAEVQRILDMGVELQLDTKVDDLVATMRDGRFDAAFVAVGAHLGKRAYIPAGSAAKIIDAVSMLRSMEGEAPRTAKRLGADEAIIVYRRTRDRMPAHDFEVEEALEEGVLMKWLSTVKHAEGGKLVLERMELDDTGFPQPTGELEELAADSLVLALGQESDLGLLERIDDVRIEDGMVQIGPDLMTGHPGVFAGGDIVPAERTVTMAIGHGKAAAHHVDAWLRGTTYQAAGNGAVVGIGDLNTWYYADAPKTLRPQLDVVRRQSTFDEVVQGLDETTALFEARRCLSCGNCFACDNCYGVCPDNAVLKLEPAGAYAYAIDLDYCKGCGLCAAECPAGAIHMQPEAI